MWKFVKSAPDKENWLNTTELQLCLWGKSNVGKSSLLNAITGQNISYVSKEPGRTQFINYFTDNNDKIIVDLPGYGFAKLAKNKQVLMLQNIFNFLSDKNTKKHLLWLIDSKTGITNTDIKYINFLRSINWPIDLIYTKIDKLNQKEKHQLIVKHNELINNNFLNFVNNVFFISSTKNINTNELITYIDHLLYN
ncbi:ribosome biogenesis GTP-binding protein YihA/YsxC [Mycoplasma sp. 1018B]|uniref:ribosome biogenesis GTP-binding protein YihA/YsxC n=1 Tax=Mycoplasma sp. 1018B TaxID=2967302 RepID=UPI00211CBE4A|nr:ribosome biogenesis GTP-binding protein YihA/YsxC [Mycoplasma sp. 1018B]UUM19217.1 ribosome biogenesis GTP-binding protein YihA/YsxC [Mycoplasma sp. 1018B]